VDEEGIPVFENMSLMLLYEIEYPIDLTSAESTAVGHTHRIEPVFGRVVIPFNVNVRR